MSFIELVFATTIGGLLVVSTIGWSLYVAWKWVWKDAFQSMVEAYEVYQSKLEQSFKENK